MKEENLSTIKRYPITAYLESKGITPVRRMATYVMYRSPLRDDRHPSFKVDTEKNLWIDYSEGAVAEAQGNRVRLAISPSAGAFNLRTPTEISPTSVFDLCTPTEISPTSVFDLRTPTEISPTSVFDLRTPTEISPTSVFDLRTPTEISRTSVFDLRTSTEISWS